MIEHIYIHIPFCIKKCSYCSFYSVPFENELKNQYLKQLKEEIKYYSNLFEIKPITIYFGGGTPSLLNPKDIESILSYFNLQDTSEVTLEVNPGSVSFEKLAQYKYCGINRLSIGVQSMNDNELKILNRVHSANDIKTLYNRGINNIFDNISCDLIYALPKQSIIDTEYSLNEILKFSPEHISIYCLSLEEDVSLYKQAKYIPEDSIVSEMYYNICKILQDYDYEHYEISNFCKNTKYSFHNLSYWSGKFYLGLGAGASGYIPDFRYTNNNLTKYLQPENFVKEKIPISKADKEIEFIITSLRKIKGFSITDFNNKFNCHFLDKYSITIKKLLKYQLIVVDENVRINSKYYFLSNEVLCEFI